MGEGSCHGSERPPSAAALRDRADRRFGSPRSSVIRGNGGAQIVPLGVLVRWGGRGPAQGMPFAEDLDRVEVLRVAAAGLPGGPRRAVELYYFADLPAGLIGGPLTTDRREDRPAGCVRRRPAYGRAACWAQSTRRSEGRSVEPK
jgi:hypothetical protein